MNNYVSKTANKLQANVSAGKNSLIGYFPLGFPTLPDSIEAAVAMCENGIDVLELGIPYSDPVMDGPVIQEATKLALENGFRVAHVFDAVSQIAARTSVPVLVMTYWNPVLAYGVEKFASDLAKAGASGLITPDLVPDEASEWLSASDKYNLDRIFLAAPTSTNERVSNAARLSRGFVYAVSTMGITGERINLDANARSVVSAIRAADKNQIAAVGIGISTKTQVQEVNDYADAAIVGSVFVKAYLEGGLASLITKVRELIGGVEQ